MKTEDAAFPVLIIMLLAVGVLWVSEATHASNLQNKLSSMENKLNSTSRQLSATSLALNEALKAQENLIGNYSKTQAALNAPGVNSSIVIWTIGQRLPAQRQIDWFLLDTFDNHINISTNGTASYILLDLTNWIRFERNLPYSPIVEYNGTHFIRDVRISQGCSGITLVIWNRTNSTEQITPNVYATYAPTPFLTGDCGTPYHSP